jgi:serine/threonine-protein kinase RsbW
VRARARSNGDAEMMELQLRVPAKPENVALVRQAIGGLADGLAVGAAVLADMKTAVTEACNNVVLYAYQHEDGMLEVEAGPADSGVAVVVRDYGSGMQPRAGEEDEPSLGLGIPLIAALSNSFQIHGATGRGIEVRMTFGANGDGPTRQAGWPDGAESAPDVPQSPTKSETKAAGIAITPGPLMAPVLSRVTGMLASRADFTLNRLSDAVLVTDVISSAVSDFIPGRHAAIAIEDGDGTLDVRIGPLVKGGAENLLRSMEIPGLSRSLKELADEVKIERGGPETGVAPDADEFLLLRLSGSV